MVRLLLCGNEVALEAHDTACFQTFVLLAGLDPGRNGLDIPMVGRLDQGPQGIMLEVIDRGMGEISVDLHVLGTVLAEVADSIEMVAVAIDTVGKLVFVDNLA